MIQIDIRKMHEYQTVKTTVKDKDFEQLTSNELPGGLHAQYNCHENETLQIKT